MRRLIACLGAALLLSSCTGEDASTKPTPRASATPSAAVPVATAKPKVEIPDGPPPAELVQEDITVGTGPLVVPGHAVTVHYVLADFESKEELETSWKGSPFTFRLGNGDVIQGWDKGLLGMRVGGRRRLVIPPALAYGDAGSGHELGGKTLVFVVDVMSTGGAPAGAND